MDDIPDLVATVDEIGQASQQRPQEDPTTIAPIDAEPSPSGSKPAPPTKRIPITIITGYLGLGKSTLLDRIGRTSHKRLAIILNEFGDTSTIEKSVTIKNEQESVQEWLDLGNGCLCCTVKDNGVLAIESLIERAGDLIDYILLETTGVADPAPIAQMFWLDDALALSVYIDGVVTVVDAEHILTCLDDVGGHWHRENRHVKSAQSESPTEEELAAENDLLQHGITTAHLQIALADTVLVNKIDRLEESDAFDEKLTAIKNRIFSINLASPVHTTKFGDIGLEKILDLGAFSPEKVALSLTAKSLFHDDRISTVAIDFPFFDSAEGFKKVEKYLQYILWEKNANGKDLEVHRVKGLVVCEDEARVIQGVRDTYEMVDATNNGEFTQNKIVFIGKNLSKEDLEIELKRFI